MRLRIAGVGTFVADFKAALHVLEVRNIADEIALRGNEHSATVLLVGETAADENAAAALHVAVDTKLLHVRLVVDDQHLDRVVRAQGLDVALQ